MKTPKLLLLLLSIVLIYVFPTTFDRGLKVRLFVRHNAGFDLVGMYVGPYFGDECVASAVHVAATHASGRAALRKRRLYLSQMSTVDHRPTVPVLD